MNYSDFQVSCQYKEQIHAIRNNNSNSGYSNHILNAGHTYYGSHKDRKEGQTFKYLGKILHL
jgi:hypothetical protein